MLYLTGCSLVTSDVSRTPLSRNGFSEVLRLSGTVYRDGPSGSAGVTKIFSLMDRLGPLRRVPIAVAHASADSTGRSARPPNLL